MYLSLSISVCVLTVLAAVTTPLECSNLVVMCGSLPQAAGSQTHHKQHLPGTVKITYTCSSMSSSRGCQLSRSSQHCSLPIDHPWGMSPMVSYKQYSLSTPFSKNVLNVAIVIAAICPIGAFPSLCPSVWPSPPRRLGGIQPRLVCKFPTKHVLCKSSFIFCPWPMGAKAAGEDLMIV